MSEYLHTFVRPWCFSVAAEIILLDEPLDGVALLGIGRFDILGVTLTTIKTRQQTMKQTEQCVTSSTNPYLKMQTQVFCTVHAYGPIKRCVKQRSVSYSAENH